MIREYFLRKFDFSTWIYGKIRLIPHCKPIAGKQYWLKTKGPTFVSEDQDLHMPGTYKPEPSFFG